MFAVIMAGGGGTRLWPKSREHYPKQMHALAGVKPLVQEMTERLQGIVGDDEVYIITNAHHKAAMVDVMPDMAQRVLVDPFRRDTAACIGLAAVYLSRVDPNAVMGIFAADHYIGLEDRFAEVVRTAEDLAAEGHVVTIGIRPTEPSNGYGYIEMDGLFRNVRGRDVFKVDRFVEKPDLATAEQYLAAGNYLWNSGMFVWSIPTIFALFEKHLPDTYARLMKIRDALDKPGGEDVLLQEYEQMQRISVDYGIMEKLDEILVIPGDFEWNDIGSWSTVSDIAERDEHGNVVKAPHVGLDTNNCLIVGAEGKVVATVGVEDLIIVDTDDALLICHKDRAQEVKKIVDILKELGHEEYL